jgi:hypothetical protein
MGNTRSRLIGYICLLHLGDLMQLLETVFLTSFHILKDTGISPASFPQISNRAVCSSPDCTHRANPRKILRTLHPCIFQQGLQTITSCGIDSLLQCSRIFTRAYYPGRTLSIPKWCDLESLERSAKGAALHCCAGPLGLFCSQFLPRADARGYSLPALRA